VQSTRLTTIGVNFFLGIEERMADDDLEEKPNADVEVRGARRKRGGGLDQSQGTEHLRAGQVDHHSHSKKTKARHRDTMKQIKKRKKAISAESKVMNLPDSLC
jgi:hypothetical protein